MTISQPAASSSGKAPRKGRRGVIESDDGEQQGDVLTLESDVYYEKSSWYPLVALWSLVVWLSHFSLWLVLCFVGCAIDTHA